VTGCDGLVCAVGEPGLSVLEPATGHVRWSSTRWRLAAAGGLVVSDDGAAARVDLATGRVLRDLGAGTPAGDLMLRAGDGDRMWVTRLRSGRVLAELTGVAPRGCQARGAYLACTTAGSRVTVWRVSS
jgi:outer membrane protein assembly factor BamB